MRWKSRVFLDCWATWPGAIVQYLICLNNLNFLSHHLGVTTIGTFSESVNLDFDRRFGVTFRQHQHLQRRHQRPDANVTTDASKRLKRDRIFKKTFRSLIDHNIAGTAALQPPYRIRVTRSTTWRHLDHPNPLRHPPVLLLPLLIRQFFHTINYLDFGHFQLKLPP